jgi:hypothetical protein
MRRNLKAFEKVFPRHASAIKKLVKENINKVSKEEGMAKLMQLIEKEQANWALKRKKS